MLHPRERLPALSRQTRQRSLARAGCCSATLNPLSLVTAGLLCAILSPGLFLCLPAGHECQERPVEHSSVCVPPWQEPWPGSVSPAGGSPWLTHETCDGSHVLLSRGAGPRVRAQPQRLRAAGTSLKHYDN